MQRLIEKEKEREIKVREKGYRRRNEGERELKRKKKLDKNRELYTGRETILTVALSGSSL